MFICILPVNLGLYRQTVRFRKENLKIKANLKKCSEYFCQKKLRGEIVFSEYRVLQGIGLLNLLKENLPLESLLKMKNINLSARESPRDKPCEVIRGADETILDWLKSKSKLKPISGESDIQPTQNQILLEDEFGFQENENALESFFNKTGSSITEFT